MKRYIFVMMLLLTAAVSCEMCRGMRSVGVREFSRYVNKKNVVVIDVRTAEEYSQGHIAGTDFNFDVLDESFEKMILENVSPDSTVAIYCRSGNRSKTAGAVLEKNCYHVIELESGFNGWVEAGKAVEK